MIKLTMNTEKSKRVNFDLPPDIHSKLKAYCAKNGITIKDFITAYIKEFLMTEGKNKN
jgi:parG